MGTALTKIFQEGLLKREDLFLQTKFTYQRGQDHRLPYDPNADIPTQIRQSFASSLEHLQTDYLDSYLLHGPASSSSLTASDWEVWRTLEELQRAGRVKYIGVSNVNCQQLRSLVSKAKVFPTFVQNRCYAKYRWDREIRGICLEHGIVYQGFSLLTANPEVFGHPDFKEICLRTQAQPAQVVFNFCRRLQMLPLTGTTNPNHMNLDLRAFDFELLDEEIRTLEVISLARI